MKKELYQILVELHTDYNLLIGVTNVSKEALKVIKKYEKYGWKDWDGGDCPVTRNKRVKVKDRDGEVFCDLAKYFIWDHRGYGGDIVKYKVVKKGK